MEDVFITITLPAHQWLAVASGLRVTDDESLICDGLRSEVLPDLQAGFEVIDAHVETVYGEDWEALTFEEDGPVEHDEPAPAPVRPVLRLITE